MPQNHESIILNELYFWKCSNLDLAEENELLAWNKQNCRRKLTTFRKIIQDLSLGHRQRMAGDKHHGIHELASFQHRAAIHVPAIALHKLSSVYIM